MHRASPSSDGPTHEVPAGAALRNVAAVLVAPVRPSPVPASLPSRPTLLPLSFVLTLIGAVGFGSSVRATLAVAALLRPASSDRSRHAAGLVETKTLANEAPRITSQ